MSESILQEWENEAKAAAAGIIVPRFAPKLLVLLARDKIMRGALEKYIDATKLTFWHKDDMQIAQTALAEADKILETTNKGEIK